MANVRKLESAVSTGSRGTVGSIFSDGEAGGNVKFFNALRFAEGDTVWVKGDRETLWDFGQVIAASKHSENDAVVVRTKLGRDVVTARAFGGETVAISGDKVGYSDMTSMKYVNEPQILENLRVRSENDKAYTFLGPVLVAMNPLKDLADEVAAGDPKVLSFAHPHAVAELAFQQMLFAVKRPEESAESPTNQTIIVSGESGAGKTVSSKKVLNHLVARSGGGELAKALLGSNPIMESFGNAQTLRNPNSSRFGKLLEVAYDERGNSIIGARIGTYLLERSRITQHELGERNYHIFYQLLQGADAATLTKLGLKKTDEYKMLLPRTKQASQAKIFFTDVDVSHFKSTITAFSHVGITENRLIEVFSVLAALLKLNNVDFDEVETAGDVAAKIQKDSAKTMTEAAQLFGVSEKDLIETLTLVERKVGGTIIKSPVAAAQAKQLVDGVSKAIYSRLFEFIVNVVNQTISHKSSGSTNLPSIGVLDIFGFETFKKNDLEQLLINYTNEALQLTFNKQVLEAEAALYQREKLAISEADRVALDPSQVVDISNKICIDMLQGVQLETKKEGKKRDHVPGILDVIHEQGRVPKPTEKKLLERLHRTFGGKEMYPNYIIVKKDAAKRFTVKHYAGKVKYTVGNFLLKNNDTLPKTTDELFLSSTKETVKALWDCGPRAQGKQKASIVSTFRNQISQLSTDLNATTCSFIRCIKPNQSMHRKEGWFDKRYVIHQMRNLSIAKTADVLKAGLPTRIPYAQLVDNYKQIFGSEVLTPESNDERGIKSFIAALFFAFEVPRSAYKLGLTKVFFKSGDLQKLEEVLSSSETWKQTPLDPSDEAERDIIIQRFKKYHIRRRWRVILAYFFAGQMFKKLHLSQKKRKEDEKKAAILLQAHMRRFVQRRKYAAMLYAKRLEEEKRAREKAEAERRERERLAAEARARELEKERQLRAFMEQRREQQRKEAEKFAKLRKDFKKANKAAADFKKQEAEMKRQERERREAEEKIQKEEAEKQKQELEKLRLEREAEERRAFEAAEAERKAKEAYEEKLTKLALEEAEQKALAEKNKKSAEEQLVTSESYKNFIEGKLKRDQEKLEEKQVMEQVTEELLQRQEEKEAKLYEEEEQEQEESNPWFFYEDLDLEEIDKVSDGGESEEEEKINDALRFLDNLGDADSDDEEEEHEESDLEELEKERNYEMVKKADKGVTAAKFKEYNGPYIVNVNVKRLEESGAPKKRFRLLRQLNAWKQCFAFIYPSHQKLMLHHGVDNMMKIEFRKDAMLKDTTYSGKKKNVVDITGVKFSDKDGADISRELLISFQDVEKRDHFVKLIGHFVKDEHEIAAAAAKKANKGRRTSEPMAVANTIGRVATMKQRHERRDALRQQNYKKLALLNQAFKKGKLKKERLHELLLQDEDEEEDDDYTADLTMCVKCRKTVQVNDAICQHCGAPQTV